MRLHRNLVFAVIDALNMIFNQGEYADKVVEKVLRRDKRWGSRDRGFIAETTYEIVRYKRLYQEIAEVKTPFSRADLFRIIGVWITLRGIPLPEWEQFKNTPARRIKGKFDELAKIRKFREAVPDWLDELGVQSLGKERWSRELAALNQQAAVVLRVNRLKTDLDALQKELSALKIPTTRLKGYEDALLLEQRTDVFKTPLFKKGWFEVQDASSQLVAPFLQVEPGQLVVDACAGAGGKSLHLAALMENKGQLLALDIYDYKLKQLKLRARRNGVHNLESRLIQNTKVIKRLNKRADRVLIDAPCTGMGVLRRNPDAKWKLNPEFLERVTAIQRQILEDYSKMVKPGGKIVYATCSILPRENEEQVQEFLKKDSGSGFVLEEEKHCSPADDGFDGFYMARLRRK
ncbi:RsmB/NOP family class I SAM-dependent RNA methyltransferase [Lentiprolixibacter aurantiacus]|uniref:RsmB/NOP family class I SAM-dependent RNA methyltransferase n=1 Tax=Lentiprolixibacter aurantiacus TaxID=2993939 RepID=A0AAE3MML8_9FLAO|nr:RsmB/NOP family class I SAM-dependent RNA methyltransferase [Lentiprolixibacter aurantiacus]MCX2720244.1 RsmB/NOP family class I SAM-dependent RNA methyltransferase [Lentiprolixibacter aurantiacus]